MAELADIYDGVRQSISTLAMDLSDKDLARTVPATPDWTIRDVVSHLTGDTICVIAGDFPAAFFNAIGEPEAIRVLNQWTAEHVASRKEQTLPETIAEWEDGSKQMTSMMRGDTPWPDNVPGDFAGRVMLTDVTVHQQDIYGALEIERDRDDVPIKMGAGGYIATMDLRLKSQGGPALRVEVPEKTWTAGGDEPVATVRVPSRWELFRAMSGRRNPDQIRAYDWDGDPEPFVEYFYIYGVRADALEE